MRRADRLFQLVQLVRGRRLTTARFLAERLEVSERTVYRDIADLQAQGVPIDGAAGVGYRMRAGFDLPPLMFTRDEAQALVASVRVARPHLDDELVAHAESALAKIVGVLPPAARAAARPATCRRSAAQGPLRLRRSARRGHESNRAAARLRVLGRRVDAGRLVRVAHRLPQLPARSHAAARGARRALSRRAGQDA